MGCKEKFLSLFAEGEEILDTDYEGYACIEKDIKDIPAFSSIKGKELVSRLFEQTENTKLTLSHKVKKIFFSTGEDQRKAHDEPDRRIKMRQIGG